MILGWLLDQKYIKPVLNGKLVEGNMIECRPEKISSAIMDESVDVHLVHRYFSYDAWLNLEEVMEKKNERDIWTCATIIIPSKDRILYM